MVPIGFVAVIAGWLVTEVGRQPWTVYGVLRTVHSVSPSLTGSDVLISLLAYVAVYLVMYPAGVLLMWRIVRRGPEAVPAEEEPTIEGGRPKAPVLAGGKVAGGGGQ
jgi:cytochrome d ubiquinol oxidase subunit I